MKKRLVILPMIFVCMFTLIACSRQIKSSADELTTRNWKIQNLSGIEAFLEFKDDTAAFTIYDPNENKAAVIEGALAIDNNKFYITSEKYCKNFEFEYRAFKDRAEIIYNGETLVFTPLENTVQEYSNSTSDEYR